MVTRLLNEKHRLTWAVFFALGSATVAHGQAPTAPQLPGTRPMPGPMAAPMPGKAPIEERNVPAEVEHPPAPAQRLAAPGDQPLPMPDEIEERQAGPDLHGDAKKPCPKTIVLKAPPPNAATPYAPDFPSTPGAQWIEPNFNGTTPNRHVRHTFQWDGCKQNKCCEVYKAKLEVKVKALLNGLSNSSADAGNDAISIWKNGTVLYSQPIYTTFPVAAGSVKTLTIPVQPSWLDGCRLSFQVQDDSAVLDAKLVVSGCCVKPNFKP
ncbi:MAG: hypothetical protein KatS3mg122_0825 [Caldimonas sp.]|uniref:hypothetical protein n=1 Tax=Caldimonas taiwanensis TaxID=307483 RepID=UPI0007851047|nr:hypothetical protein [Caldimonas taiwanensis]GIX23594.1 MAG: hypothetical protein KatS3mg122_0825 [Caldimonas sp.]